jgi:hypothetical protein
MQRMLVWPWHGLIKDGAVQLKDGSIRAYNQPLNFPSAQYGSGDTHKIVVPNIEPLSDAEISQAPAGGEYWAGQALISAGSLYNQIINGWIYQALDGSRWQISVLNRTLTDTDATLQLRASLFGEFGRAGETHTTTLNVAVGRLADRTLRTRIFADLGPATASVIRLHSVSESGRTAIFAWMAYNDLGQDEQVVKVLDSRPRAYMYYKVWAEGSHAQLQVRGQILYTLDDILSVSTEAVGSTLRCSFAPGIATEEVGREPYFDSTGAPAGEKVTYNYSEQVPIVTMEGGQWRSPSSWVIRTRWMVMVSFTGETPKPCYLTATDTGMVGSASFTRITDTQYITQEYPDGSFNVLQEGASHVEGGGSSGGNFTIAWEGAESSWSAQIAYGAVYHTIGSLQTTVTYCDDQSSSSSASGAFQMEPVGYGELIGSGDGRVPQAGAGIFGLAKHYSFSLYSNNLIGVSLKNGSGDERFIGCLTVDGFTAQPAPYPSDDVRHFGSYNPFTNESVIGSPAPINWV